MKWWKNKYDKWLFRVCYIVALAFFVMGGVEAIRLLDSLNSQSTSIVVANRVSLAFLPHLIGWLCFWFLSAILLSLSVLYYVDYRIAEIKGEQ